MGRRNREASKNCHTLCATKCGCAKAHFTQALDGNDVVNRELLHRFRHHCNSALVSLTRNEVAEHLSALHATVQLNVASYEDCTFRNVVDTLSGLLETLPANAISPIMREAARYVCRLPCTCCTGPPRAPSTPASPASSRGSDGGLTDSQEDLDTTRLQEVKKLESLGCEAKMFAREADKIFTGTQPSRISLLLSGDGKSHRMTRNNCKRLERKLNKQKGRAAALKAQQYQQMQQQQQQPPPRPVTRHDPYLNGVFTTGLLTTRPLLYYHRALPVSQFWCATP
eukprot:Rhum_TRINITY_DN15425_c1_g1::Rhum_TRINITY_DN15425_c1_g1_i1::g.157409::m.157409